MRCDAVIFDLDGTLIDTKELILESFRRATREVLGTRPRDEEVLGYIGIPLIEQVSIIAPDHVEELMESYQRHNSALHDDLIGSFKGTPEMLATLRRQGRLLGVVTSKRTKPARRGLDSFDLSPYFEVVMGMEDSEKHKPDPVPLLSAAGRLGVDPYRCAYVGDSIYDMQAARGAKMVAIAAMWGMHTPAQLREAGAMLEAWKPADICTVIEAYEAGDGQAS